MRIIEPLAWLVITSVHPELTLCSPLRGLSRTPGSSMWTSPVRAATLRLRERPAEPGRLSGFGIGWLEVELGTDAPWLEVELGRARAAAGGWREAVEGRDCGTGGWFEPSCNGGSSGCCGGEGGGEGGAASDGKALVGVPHDGVPGRVEAWELPPSAAHAFARGATTVFEAGRERKPGSAWLIMRPRMSWPLSASRARTRAGSYA